MGDCASRPEPDELEVHERSNDKKNDGLFVREAEFPQLEDIDKPILTADDQDRARLYLEDLNKIISSLSQNQGLDSQKTQDKFLIEIQKAKNIVPNVLCVFDPQAFVKIELRPIKLAYTTSLSRPFIPSWYDFYSHTLSVKEIEKIVLKIYFKNQIVEDSLFGTVEIKLDNFSNQKLVEQWFPIKTKEKLKEKPEIKVRMQLICGSGSSLMRGGNKEEAIAKAVNYKSIIERRIRECENKMNAEALGN